MVPGKSTIFRMILNLIEPTEGEITFNNENINRRNYARSFFCWMLIILVVAVLFLIGSFVIAAASGAL